MLLEIADTADVDIWSRMYNDNWLAEIFGGLFTSVLFLILVYWFRPRVKISPEIARQERKKDDGTTEVRYLVKVVNRSFWKVIDLHFEAMLLKPVPAPKGQNLHMKRLDLYRDSFTYLRGRYKFWEKNRNATNCILVTITSDLATEWDEESQFMSFKVIAKHGLTGFPRIEKEQYDHKSSVIKIGNFEWGDSVCIKKSK